ncbi:hypothetical protein LC1Hm_0325 [Halomicrobium sp. LC1Hm]|nr:hypothetical protein LC1Hm_0325 [Halomicrobium sp. LC1Hm]
MTGQFGSGRSIPSISVKRVGKIVPTLTEWDHHDAGTTEDELTSVVDDLPP